MNKAFIAVCYAAAKKAGVDTSKMSVDQVIDWYNKNKNGGGSSSPKEKIKSSIEKIKAGGNKSGNSGNNQPSDDADSEDAEITLTIEKQYKEKEEKKQQEKEKALTRSKEKGIIHLPEEEYAKISSEVNSNYANKIPSTGFHNSDGYSYRFKYDQKTNKLVCTKKIDIEKHRELMEALEEEDDGTN